MVEDDEILMTVDHLKQFLETMLVRGLRSLGPAETKSLTALQAELSRIGATHLAERAGALLAAVEADPRTAATELLRTQTSLRMFERVLTLETAADVLGALCESEANCDGHQS